MAQAQQKLVIGRDFNPDNPIPVGVEPQEIVHNQIVRIDSSGSRRRGEDNPGFDLIVSPVDPLELRAAMITRLDYNVGHGHRWWFPINPPKILLRYGSDVTENVEAYIDASTGGFHHVPGTFIDAYGILGWL